MPVTVALAFSLPFRDGCVPFSRIKLHVEMTHQMLIQVTLTPSHNTPPTSLRSRSPSPLHTTHHPPPYDPGHPHPFTQHTTYLHMYPPPSPDKILHQHSSCPNFHTYTHQFLATPTNSPTLQTPPSQLSHPLTSLDTPSQPSLDQ